MGVAPVLPTRVHCAISLGPIDLSFASLGPCKDTVKGGRGNDEIHADDGHKDAIVCNAGTDEVWFDQGLDQVADGCELKHPA